MRKIVMLNRISIDGFFAGAQGEIDWFIHENAVDQAAHEMMRPDTLLLGRVTYQMFESYWPPVGRDPGASPQARKTAEELNRMTKLVFSRTLREVAWENTILVKDDLIRAVLQLKQGQGADVTLFGSGTIARQLAGKGLIDEFLLILTPVVLGSGQSLFSDLDRMQLKLGETRIFPSGNVLLHYTR